jgi:hypothetical protein
MESSYYQDSLIINTATLTPTVINMFVVSAGKISSISFIRYEKRYLFSIGSYQKSLLISAGIFVIDPLGRYHLYDMKKEIFQYRLTADTKNYY